MYRECYVVTISSAGFFSLSPAMLSAMYVCLRLLRCVVARLLVLQAKDGVRILSVVRCVNVAIKK